ncbi:MAG: hypothetical protein L6U99_07320 [Clostridium sp.]|nr:MAG: hypothetical protein L6U99_07320 [Clostridium sp.]
MGRYYAGGTIGIMSRNASVSMLTTNGSVAGIIDSSIASSFSNTASGYIDGIALGGVIGYTEASALRIKDVLSKMNLTSSIYTNVVTNYYIGGIVGCGYFNEVNGLFYKGTITNSFSNSFNSVYCAGVIGDALGTKNSVLSLHNQGDIIITTNSASPKNKYKWSYKC